MVRGKNERELIMTEKTNRSPSHRVYTVKGSDKHSRWVEIGAAWINADAQGFTIVLDALPIDGRLVVRVKTDNEVDVVQ